MLFNSLTFWLYLPVVLGLYWTIPQQRINLQNAFLLAASYFFYGFWDMRFLGLILLSTAVDYCTARSMEKASNRQRKFALYISILVNLSILGYFKYANFFLQSMHEFLAIFGMSSSFRSLDLILPIGISFYTFQSMSYTIDVYRNRIQVERNPLSFALFVAFFAQLMAGPIERAQTLLPQLKKARNWDSEEVFSGFSRFILGMVKKIVVSGPLYAWTLPLFLNPHLRSTEETWLIGIFFVLYVLMDFSGYSDMAIGIGRMMGIQLSENFRSVFRAQNFLEFWQRWHITLGRWFRDYVFIALKKRHVPKSVAVLFSFALIGFWHGATWNFILWGFAMGVLWLLDIRLDWIRRVTCWLPSGGLVRFVRSAMVMVCFIWIGWLYALEDLSQSWVFMKSMMGVESSTSGIELGFKPLGISTWLALTLAVVFEWGEPRWNQWRSHPQYERIISFIQYTVLLPIGILLCIEGLWTSREFEYFLF